MEYVALHNHSWFSILDATMPVEQIVEAAKTCHMPAVGLVDTDGLTGAVQFYKKSKEAGIHPVIGSLVSTPEGHSLCLLVENAGGYRNLCRLLTRGLTRDLLNLSRDGLICLYGPRNPVAQSEIAPYREIFGKSFALEISPHNDEDKKKARSFLDASRRMRVPLVATAESHYLIPEDRRLYDMVASMRTLTLLGQTHKDKLPPGNFHFHSPEEMSRQFQEMPHALKNTLRIAERCRFDFPLGDIHFPEFPSGPEGATAMLRRLSEDGLRNRYGPAPGCDKRQRLERELSVIEQTGYAGYFLIFADIVSWANRNGIASLARGSAAGSLVCYTLGISNVCPFRFGLCFERFLNRERMQFSKLADIDLDLPWDRRDQVVNYVFERYGAGHVAMIGAVNTFQGRAAVADLAKVFGIPEREVRRFTEHLPHFSGDASAIAARTPECRHLPLDQEPYRTVFNLAARLEGAPRHRMMHPCGLVISASPVEDRMPLFVSAKGLPTTQFTMDDVEELGLLKMDLLGQAGLSVLRDACANIHSNHGVAIDTAAIDQQDAITWESIATGQARGVFHIESPAMTGLLEMSNCRDIDCLTAVESIIRPGAANEGKKRAFARRHQGLEPVSFSHPSLQPLLADTYGLMAYEEHILLVANGFAGMNWGRADMLRRALVKNRDPAKIQQFGEEFRQCARERGHPQPDIEAVWKMVADFAGYMFNKAHSAAYAVEAYQGAWLKARYPVEFLAAVLSNRRGFYSPIFYVLEALRNGAHFLPPDVNLSAERCLVTGNSIRLPLDQIKGLPETTVQRLLLQRPFTDAGDLFRRGRLRSAEWLSLLKAGALGSLNESRSRLFWRLARLESVAGSGTLIEPLEPEAAGNPLPVPQWEQELLGFPVSCHPLDYYGAGVNWSRYLPARQIKRHLDQQVEVCGLIVCDRQHPTSRGIMKFLTLADYSGFVEVALFAEAYQNYGHLTTRPIVAVRAHVDPFDNRKGAVLNAQRLSLPERSQPPRG
ncbi:MAG: DNA polymerase III subunit alpha [Acidobacteriia bacterium]|nr:DNA polymerase III subunit alpha [Terriglobia bacterium]